MVYDINMTAMSGMTPSQIISYVHNSIAVPELILLLAVIFIIFFGVGMLIIHGRQSKLRFMGIWSLSLVFSIVVLTGFIYLPNTVESIIKYFGNLL